MPKKSRKIVGGPMKRSKRLEGGGDRDRFKCLVLKLLAGDKFMNLKKCGGTKSGKVETVAGGVILDDLCPQKRSPFRGVLREMGEWEHTILIWPSTEVRGK